jgi:phenylpyruvate tautomerase PptA (4-oxalocrotonate tautomerase family)
MLDEVTEATAAWLKSNSPSIVVTRSPVEPERLIEGVAFVSAETRAVESIFDGTLWEVRASP